MFLRISIVEFHTEKRLYYDIHCMQGQFPDAEPLYERCHVILEKVLGAEHPDLATILNNRAELLMNLVRAARKRHEVSRCSVDN